MLPATAPNPPEPAAAELPATAPTPPAAAVPGGEGGAGGRRGDRAQSLGGPPHGSETAPGGPVQIVEQRLGVRVPIARLGGHGPVDDRLQVVSEAAGGGRFGRAPGPAAISLSKAPTEYTSLAGVSCSPANASGLAYAPMPAASGWPSQAANSTSFGVPSSSIRMVRGDTLPCTTPFRCAYAKPSRAPRSTPSRWRHGELGVRWS